MKKLYTHYKNEVNDKPSFLVGQKAFIVNTKGQVLIIKRHDKSTQSAKWDFPGGRLGFSESLREGLEREIREETGLILTKVSFPLSLTTFLRDIDRNTQITRIIYLCKTKGKIKLSSEHSDFLWIAPSAYKNYQFIDQDYYLSFQNYSNFKSKVIEFLGQGMLKESLNFRNNK